MEKLEFYSDMVRKKICDLFDSLTEDYIDAAYEEENEDDSDVIDDKVINDIYQLLLENDDSCMIGVLAADFYERNKIRYDMKRTYKYESNIIEFIEKNGSSYDNYIDKFINDEDFAHDLIDNFIDYSDDTKEEKERNRLYIKVINKENILKNYNKIYLLDNMSIEYDKKKKQKILK